MVQGAGLASSEQVWSENTGQPLAWLGVWSRSPWRDVNGGRLLGCRPSSFLGKVNKYVAGMLTDTCHSGDWAEGDQPYLGQRSSVISRLITAWDWRSNESVGRVGCGSACACELHALTINTGILCVSVDSMSFIMVIFINVLKFHALCSRTSLRFDLTRSR